MDGSDYGAEVAIWSSSNPSRKQRLYLPLPFTLKYDPSIQTHSLLTGLDAVTVDHDLGLHVSQEFRKETGYWHGKKNELRLKVGDELQMCRVYFKLLQVYPEDRKKLPWKVSTDANDVCRICRDAASADDPLLTQCNCKGDTKCIHLNCIREWNKTLLRLDLAKTAIELRSKVLMCEICKASYVQNPDVNFPELLSDQLTGIPLALVRVKPWKAAPMLMLMNLARITTIGSSPVADICVKSSQLDPIHSQMQYFGGVITLHKMTANTDTFILYDAPIRLSTATPTLLRCKNHLIEIRPKRNFPSS